VRPAVTGATRVGVAIDTASGRILRSVLMKPETEARVPALHQQVLSLLADA
jgi:hypothetical protein